MENKVSIVWDGHYMADGFPPLAAFTDDTLLKEYLAKHKGVGGCELIVTEIPLNPKVK